MEINFHASKKSVLESISCLDAAYALGLRTKIKGRYTYVECPFHTSRIGKPDKCIGNCKISDNGKNCYCFSCNGSGNAIEMVMAYEGLNFAKQLIGWHKLVLPSYYLTNGKYSHQRRYVPIQKNNLMWLVFILNQLLFQSTWFLQKNWSCKCQLWRIIIWRISSSSDDWFWKTEWKSSPMYKKSTKDSRDLSGRSKNFYEIVIPKAKAAHKKYMKMFKKTKMLPQNDLTILILEELSKK